MNREQQREYDRLRYLANPERRRDWTRAWRLANPEKRAEQARRESSVNPEYHRERVARWKASPPERVATWNAARRAVRLGAGTAEPISRMAIYQRDEGRCHICGRKVSSKKFHLDHLVPLSKGGTHTENNVAVAHPRCNMRRGPGRLPAQLL